MARFREHGTKRRQGPPGAAGYRDELYLKLSAAARIGVTEGAALQVESRLRLLELAEQDAAALAAAARPAPKTADARSAERARAANE